MNEAAGAIVKMYPRCLKRILSIEIRASITGCGKNFVIGRNNRIMELFPSFCEENKGNRNIFKKYFRYHLDRDIIFLYEHLISII